MKRTVLGAFALVGLLTVGLLASAPSEAAQIRVCGASAAGAALGPKQVRAPTSGTTYSVNARGCVRIAPTDLGDFQAQGYIQDSTLHSIVYTTGTMSGTTAVNIGTLPAGTYIREIIVNNTTASAITGGIGFGSTSGATDIVTALTCGASCMTFVADSALKLRVFSTTAVQAIYASAVTSWAGANATITVIYGYF